MKRVIIAETDRIGDVVLALPSFYSIKRQNKDIFVAGLVRDYTAPLFKLGNFADDIISIYPESSEEEIIQKIRYYNFDTAIALHPELRVAKIFKKAGIPLRISYGWKWYQFYFNKVIIQHRSKNKKHQLEYNLDIIKFAGIEKIEKDIKLKIPVENKNNAQKILKKSGIKKDFIIIHPGHGGSSRALPPDKFIELIETIKKEFKKIEILITGSLNDRKIIEYIIGNTTVGLKIIPLNTNLLDFAGIISLARCFISNSTGPMHIASGLRTPVVAFFSPVFIQSPIRWGPYWGKKLVIIPPVKCPYKWKCKFEKCRFYDCFQKIDFTPVIEFLKSIGLK